MIDNACTCDLNNLLHLLFVHIWDHYEEVSLCLWFAIMCYIGKRISVWCNLSSIYYLINLVYLYPLICWMERGSYSSLSLYYLVKLPCFLYHHNIEMYVIEIMDV